MSWRSPTQSGRRYATSTLPLGEKVELLLHEEATTRDDGRAGVRERPGWPSGRPSADLEQVDLRAVESSALGPVVILPRQGHSPLSPEQQVFGD